MTSHHSRANINTWCFIIPSELLWCLNYVLYMCLAKKATHSVGHTFCGTHTHTMGWSPLGKRKERLQLNTNINYTPVPGVPGVGSGIWALEVLTTEPRIRICSILHGYMQRNLKAKSTIKKGSHTLIVLKNTH